jgi:hypothetical protein
MPNARSTRNRNRDNIVGGKRKRSRRGSRKTRRSRKGRKGSRRH